MNKMSKLRDRMNDAEFEAADDETPVDWDDAIEALEEKAGDDEAEESDAGGAGAS